MVQKKIIEDEFKKGPDHVFLELEKYKQNSYLTHNLHPYPAKFIPQIPKELIVRLSKKNNWVIDNPFLRGETLRKNIHPTVKPLKLMTYILTIGSRPGDTILDPFMGSGTTGVAAKILHRDFIGFEIERKYFEIAQQRIENKAACKDILSYPYEESESIKETDEKE